MAANRKPEYRWQLKEVWEKRYRGGRWRRKCLYSFPDPDFKLLLTVESLRDLGFWAMGVTRNTAVPSRTNLFDESSSNSLIQSMN